MTVDVNLWEGILFESLNGFFFVLSVFMATWIGAIIWQIRDRHDDQLWKMSIAICTYHAGMAVFFGWRWTFRRIVNLGHDPTSFVQELWWIPIVAAVIAGIGLLCKVRVTTYTGWGCWPMVICGAMGLLAASFPLIEYWRGVYTP